MVLNSLLKSNSLILSWMTDIFSEFMYDKHMCQTRQKYQYGQLSIHSLSGELLRPISLHENFV